MSDHLENAKAHVDTRIAMLERRRELDALIKANRILSKENEGLWEGIATLVKSFHNVILVGLIDATLPPPDALVEAEVVVAKQIN